MYQCADDLAVGDVLALGLSVVLGPAQASAWDIGRQGTTNGAVWDVLALGLSVVLGPAQTSAWNKGRQGIMRKAFALQETMQASFLGQGQGLVLKKAQAPPGNDLKTVP